MSEFNSTALAPGSTSQRFEDWGNLLVLSRKYGNVVPHISPITYIDMYIYIYPLNIVRYVNPIKYNIFPGKCEDPAHLTLQAPLPRKYISREIQQQEEGYGFTSWIDKPVCPVQRYGASGLDSSKSS